MKKTACILLAVLMLCACAAAETIHVTISDDQGKLVMAHEALDVTDIDGNAAITIYDALHAAHEAAYEGGAAAGLAASSTDYGLSLVKLWGVENGDSYGYYVDTVSAYSLVDPLADGAHLQVFAYTDLETWSDTYCFFDFAAIETSADFELTLSAQTYDADWNPVYIPVEGAMITINGEDSGIMTDAGGKAVIDIAEAGEYVISAHSDSMLLVPPVCVATIV